MKRHTLVTAMALALGATAAMAGQDAPRGSAQEASIPFANQRSNIRDWQADKDEGLWVQDAHRQWYYARLMTPCYGLDFALQVGFRTRGTSSLDRFGEVIVPGHDRCPISSFTKSDAPPGRNDKPAVEAEAADSPE